MADSTTTEVVTEEVAATVTETPVTNDTTPTVEAETTDATNVGQQGYKFLLENATLGNNGDWSITQKNYIDFMNRNGIPENTLRQVSKANSELTVGMYLFNNDKLKEAIREAQAAQTTGNEGNGSNVKDPKEVDVTTVVKTIDGGSIKVKVNALREFRNPTFGKETDENDEGNEKKKIAHYAYTTVTVNSPSPFKYITDEQRQACENDIKELLGL